MTLKRIKELHRDFGNALERLKEALSRDASEGSIIVDGTIQRFEFCFELAWKLAKAVLNYNGVDVESPRPVIKEAYKTKTIENGEEWINMLEDKNKSSHLYDEKQALRIYENIKKNHYKTLKSFNGEIRRAIAEIKEER